MALVYRHTNILTGKSYVGKTITTVRTRWKFHCISYRTANASSRFTRALQKYGQSVWYHQVLEDGLNEAEALEREKYWIRRYRTMDPEYGYNMTEGGEGISGYQHTAESKRKIAIRSSRKRPEQKPHPQTEKAKSLISKAMKGRVLSKAHREKLRQAWEQRRLTPTNEETRAKMSATKKGKPKSEDHRRKLGDSNRGRKHTDQARKNMSEAAKTRRPRRCAVCDQVGHLAKTCPMVRGNVEVCK